LPSSDCGEDIFDQVAAVQKSWGSAINPWNADKKWQLDFHHGVVFLESIRRKPVDRSIVCTPAASLFVG
jgi:hypothetical protein